MLPLKTFYENNVVTDIVLLQAQANLLKNLAVTGAPITIITVGIGIDVSPQELRRLASSPDNSVVIPSLGNMTFPPSPQQLINIIFGKKHYEFKTTIIRANRVP